MKTDKFKITFKAILSVCVEIAFMSIRPILFLLIWNYVLAFEESTHIPKLDILQVVSIIVLFHIIISYVPMSIKSNSHE